MKLSSTSFAVYLAAFSASAWGAAAFTMPSMPRESSVVLRSNTASSSSNIALNSPRDGQVPRDSNDIPLMKEKPPTKFTGLDQYPKYDNLRRIQGEGTVETYKMPPWAERCQMYFETNGRPLRAQVQMWVGPIRATHTLLINMDDGMETPYQATLKFKKGVAPVIRVSTVDHNVPVWTGVSVPSEARNKELEDEFLRNWENCPSDKKLKIQGGDTDGKLGVNRYWTIPAETESVQVLAWSRDTGKKSFKVDIEVLQGPNNIRQSYSLQCGGGSQPYHCVLQTPGEGCAIRVRNCKFLEDGLVEFAILPYEEKAVDPAQTTGIVF